jgi:uncharacterized membrane protein YozB (DUF420 family)
MTKLTKTDPAYSGTMMVYVLLLGAVLLPAAFVAALIGFVMSRDSVRETAYQGHARAQMITGVIGAVVWTVGVLAYLYVNPAVALWVGLIGAAVYFYRLLRCGALFWAGEPLP